MAIGTIVEGVSFIVVGNVNQVSSLDEPVEGKMYHVMDEACEKTSYLFIPCKSGNMFVYYDKGIPIDGVEIIKENPWDELYSSGIVSFPVKGNVVIAFKDFAVTHGMLGKVTPIQEVIIVRAGGSVPVTMTDKPTVTEDGICIPKQDPEQPNTDLDEA